MNEQTVTLTLPLEDWLAIHRTIGEIQGIGLYLTPGHVESEQCKELGRELQEKGFSLTKALQAGKINYNLEKSTQLYFIATEFWVVNATLTHFHYGIVEADLSKQQLPDIARAAIKETGRMLDGLEYVVKVTAFNNITI